MIEKKRKLCRRKVNSYKKLKNVLGEIVFRIPFFEMVDFY